MTANDLEKKGSIGQVQKNKELIYQLQEESFGKMPISLIVEKWLEGFKRTYKAIR